MTEMFGEAWPPTSVPDLAPDDDDDDDDDDDHCLCLLPDKTYLLSFAIRNCPP